MNRLAFFALAAQSAAAADLPTEWIDKDTGHRVVHLSKEGGAQSLYFHHARQFALRDRVEVART